eukprot:COSAG02_NODE_1986_length_10180_cov_38.805575_9_plen_214_part_00
MLAPCALLVAVLAILANGPHSTAAEFLLLQPERFKPLFRDGKINATSPSDQGPLNEQAFAWAQANVPFFECSDKDLEAAYAFRWRAYFTHLIPTNQTTNPWVVSECFSPTIPGRCNWAAPSGAINAAAGHHIREGRWIRDPIYMDSEIRFWFHLNNGPGGSLGANGACETFPPLSTPTDGSLDPSEISEACCFRTVCVQTISHNQVRDAVVLT